MRITFIISLIFLCTGLYGQVNYTANDLINPYNGGFKAGVNPGYYGSNWKSRDLADLAAGNPATDTEGVGVRAYRGSLPEGIARQYGYSIWTPTYEYYNAIGLKDNTVFVGFASDDHKDPVEYCPGVQSDMFANLYEDIWDNGENGTPINENNYYALYLYNVINAIGDNVRFWEIWNEPGFDYSGVHGWLPPGAEGNWWENNPDPCDYKLQAPVFHYIRTLRISYEVIKTLSPDDYVVVSGVGYNSFLDVILRNTDNPIDGSVTSEYPNKGGAYFDVLGFHAYPHFDGSVRYWDNDIDDFVYTRHSDAAIEGLEERQMERADILGQYGYDGNTYPEKLWTITEINVPRKEFDENFGGEELQVNYMIKMVTNAIQNEITQTHVFGLAEKQYIDDAEDPFDVMGLYQNLKEIGPWEQTVNQSGIAYKTASDLLYQSSFDDNQTDLMNLPDNIKGGAFQQSNGEYIYVIWARTETDNTEDASANYAFPGAMGINSLTKKEWDFSQTKTSSTISSNNITLTGTPIFISPSSNQNVGELTLNCPPRLIEMGVPGADGGAIISWEEPTVSSTCSLGGATVDLVSSIPNGSFFPIGVTVVEYLATDACGNTSTGVQTIGIADTIDPTFTVPNDTTLFLTASCTIDTTTSSIGNVVVTDDNCSGTLTVDYNDNVTNLSGCNSTGTFTRTWTVSDPCGNSTTQIQTVTIADTLAPTFTLPADTTLYLDAACLVDTTIASIGTVTDTLDNCNDAMTVTYVDDLANLTGCNSTGSFDRTWTVTDACGNIALAQSFTISTTPCDCTEETNIQTCDDNDPCTINDMVTLACDDSVCVPCAGELIGPPIPSLTCPVELNKCATDGSNIMPPSIACAKAGVTTGEWADVIRAVFGQYRAPTGVSRNRSNRTEGLDDIRNDVDRVSAALGRRIKFVMGKPGLDGHSNGAEQIAARARDCGMDITYEGIRMTPDELVKSIVTENAHVVGLSILSGSHIPLVTQTLAKMQAAGLGHIPVIAGGIIPDDDAQTLLSLGVARIYTPKDFEMNKIMSDIVTLVDPQFAKAE